MRLIISLAPDRVPCIIPFSYTHALAAVVYRFLECSSHDYARFLHDEGYRAGTKRFKLFTFSQLLIRERRISPQGLVCLSPQITWQISSPVTEFVEHLATGLLQRGEMQLGGQRLAIARVCVAPPPAFAEEMRVRCLSPLVVSVAEEHDAGLRARYVRADDPRLSEALRENLLKKFLVVFGRAPARDDLAIECDREYLRRRGEEVYRLVDYKGTKIKAIMAPFVVRGSVELIALGYEAGFGEKNSMGFGMVEVTQKC
jgi:CRISPR-associated endoribonuclease Cas6